MTLERAQYDYDELMARAVAKWMEVPERSQPCRYRSDIDETPDGRVIVFLANVNGDLVDYDFRPETGELTEICEGVQS